MHAEFWLQVFRSRTRAREGGEERKSERQGEGETETDSLRFDRRS